MRDWRWRRGENRPPLVIGHRGSGTQGASLVTENTLASFERARVDGADGVELDVRCTRDDVVVVMHDPSLARMTGKRDARAVATLTLDELRRVELEGGERAPTLAEVLDWADAHAMRVNVELKHDVPNERRLAIATARLLDGRARIAEGVLLSSFQPRLLAAMRVLLPRVPRAFLFHEKQRFAKSPLLVRAIARSVGAMALHPERTLCSPERVLAWKNSGFVINVWTVNDEGEARDLAALGVDGIITDDPARVRAV